MLSIETMEKHFCRGDWDSREAKSARTFFDEAACPSSLLSLLGRGNAVTQHRRKTRFVKDGTLGRLTGAFGLGGWCSSTATLEGWRGGGELQKGAVAVGT